MAAAWSDPAERRRLPYRHTPTFREPHALRHRYSRDDHDNTPPVTTMAAFIPKHPPLVRCPVPGCDGVDDTGYGPLCPRHVCKRATCPRPKAEGSGYCTSHACDLMACSKSRLDTSTFCNIHACQYSGCVRCKQGVGTPQGASSDACEEHTCQADSCSDPRRHQRPYCRAHSCRWSGRLLCNQAVDPGAVACRDHVCRYEGGCASVRKVKSNSRACDEHTCAAPRCYRAIGLRGKYCGEHTCIWDPCSKRRGVAGSPFCETHKCEAGGCLASVMSRMDFFCEKHKCRYGGAPCQGGWSSQPPYCPDHTCALEGCGLAVRRGGRFCMAHTCALRVNGQPCILARKVGGQLCEEHSCRKCTEPRESASSMRCRNHRKEEMHYSYGPCEDEKLQHHKRKKRRDPRGVSPRPEERGSGGPVPRGVSPRHSGSKTRTPSPPHKTTLAPEAAMEMLAPTRGKGGLTTASAHIDLIPSTFRSNPDHVMAYGCGFRDAFLRMADVMTAQMEVARPMSPSRHMAKIDGPRFTTLGDDEV